MQSAFVDIGLDGDAFLYVSDVSENLEDYDHGHSHGEALAAPIAVPGGSIDLLPGESRGGRAVHEETISLDEQREEHGPEEEHAGHEEVHETAEGPNGNLDADSAQAEVHEMDERQPESNASAPQNFAPSYNPTRNYPPRWRP